MKHTLETKLTKLVKLGNGDPLWLMMVYEGVTRYVNQCAIERLPDDYVIHPDAWQRTAQEMQVVLEDLNNA